jgi:hypothetical protein
MPPPSETNEPFSCFSSLPHEGRGEAHAHEPYLRWHCARRRQRLLCSATLLRPAVEQEPLSRSVAAATSAEEPIRFVCVSPDRCRQRLLCSATLLRPAVEQEPLSRSVAAARSMPSRAQVPPGQELRSAAGQACWKIASGSSKLKLRDELGECKLHSEVRCHENDAAFRCFSLLLKGTNT